MLQGSETRKDDSRKGKDSRSNNIEQLEKKLNICAMQQTFPVLNPERYRQGTPVTWWPTQYGEKTCPWRALLNKTKLVKDLGVKLKQ